MLLEKYSRTPRDIRKFNYPPNVNNSQEFYYEVTYNISDFIKSVFMRLKDESEEIKSRKLLLNINTNGIDASNGRSYDLQDFFTDLNWVSFGQCHTLEIKEDIKKLIVSIFRHSDNSVHENFIITFEIILGPKIRNCH